MFRSFSNHSTLISTTLILSLTAWLLTACAENVHLRSQTSSGSDGQVPEIINSPVGLGQAQIFVTKGSYTPGSPQGTTRLDQICKDEALAAGIPFDFRALVSTSTRSAAQLLVDIGIADFPLYKVATDGSMVVVQDPARNLFFDYYYYGDHTTGLRSKIDYDAERVMQNPIVAWTGTEIYGSTDSATCQDWTSSSPSDSAQVGMMPTNFESLNGFPWVWIRASIHGTPCDYARHLYCIAAGRAH